MLADRERDRPSRAVQPCAIWIPLAEAPTTSTPPSGSAAGLRYPAVLTAVIPSGRSCAGCGSVAAAQAPVATTTVRACQAPRSVSTAYPSLRGRTAVTVVPVSTGAPDPAAYPVMSRATCGAVM